MVSPRKFRADQFEQPGLPAMAEMSLSDYLLAEAKEIAQWPNARRVAGAAAPALAGLSSN